MSTWADSLKDKVINFKAKMSTWADSLKDKVIDFKAKMSTWADSLKDKVISFKAKMSSWQDSLSDKIISFKAKMSSWSDSLSNKVINFKSKFTTWSDGLSSKVISFKAKMTTWSDSLSNKVINFKAKLTSWTDALSNKVINFVAKITGKKAEGGAYYGGGWHNFANGGYINAGKAHTWGIPAYANGSSNVHGSVFVAGEAGAEVVGHINGRTEVLNKSQLGQVMYQSVADGLRLYVPLIGAITGKLAECANAVISANLMSADTIYEGMKGLQAQQYNTENVADWMNSVGNYAGSGVYGDGTDQITEGVRQGVYEATARQNDLLREQNELLRDLLNKDTTVEVTANSFTKAINRKNQRDGKTVIPVST